MSRTRQNTLGKGVETMKTMSNVGGMMVLAMALVACGNGGSTTQTTAAVQSADEAATLAFVNDQALTTFDVLDSDCGLRSDTAQKIIAHRDGADGVAGTADDNLFDDLAELDAVFLVGPAALLQLKACADSFGYRPTPYELAVVNFLNDAFTDFNRLDIDCGLRSNAAANLIHHRDANPFHSLDEVDAVSQVGPAALDQLGQCASAFGFDITEPEPDPEPEPQQCTPATWDGTFDTEDYFWDVAQLTPELADVVNALQADAYAHRDPTSSYPIRLGEVYRYSLNGQVVHYEARFNQMLDLEGGIQLIFVYDLDSCGSVLNFWMGI